MRGFDSALALLCLAIVMLAACEHAHRERPSPGGGGPTRTPARGQTDGAATASGSMGRLDPASLLTARIRRLANAEYDATVQRLLATRASPAAGTDFPPDFRQGGFTVNDAQRIDAVLVERLANAADALATEARANGTLARMAPCRNRSRGSRCARAFIASFGPKVYRRPLVPRR